MMRERLAAAGLVAGPVLMLVGAYLYDWRAGLVVTGWLVGWVAYKTEV